MLEPPCFPACGGKEEEEPLDESWIDQMEQPLGGKYGIPDSLLNVVVWCMQERCKKEGRITLTCGVPHIGLHNHVWQANREKAVQIRKERKKAWFAPAFKPLW